MIPEKEKAREVIKTWSWRIKRAGLTQGEFAARIGTTGERISRWCTGRVTPNPSNFERVEGAIKALEKQA